MLGNCETETQDHLSPCQPSSSRSQPEYLCSRVLTRKLNKVLTRMLCKESAGKNVEQSADKIVVQSADKSVLQIMER